MIKEIKPDYLLKEFWPISSNQKDIMSGKSYKSFQKENYILEQKAKKNIIYNNGINYIVINNNLVNIKDKDNVKNTINQRLN